MQIEAIKDFSLLNKMNNDCINEQNCLKVK